MVNNLHTGRQQKIRANDFKYYNKKLVPSVIPSHLPRAFKTQQAAYKRAIPEVITTATQPPVNPAIVIKYPDRIEWAKAHDSELDQFDNQKVVT